MKRRSNTETLRAGLFVLAGVAFFTIAIFALGKKSALFTRTTTLFVSFPDINGLTVGTPVRLAGLEIGSVAALSLPPELERKETLVRLVVQTKYMERIRADSRAYIDTAGLLGDKIVNVSMGDPKHPALEDGATLQIGESVSFEQISANADRVIKSLDNITTSLDALVRDEGTQALPREAARAATSLANILHGIEHGPGLANRLIYDPSYAAQMEGLLREARKLARETTSAVAHVDAIVAEVEKGHGTLHELVYGEQGARAIQQFANAAQSIDQLLAEVRDGNGVLHSLLYEEGNSNFLRDLNQMSATLNGIVEDIDRGRGTVGGLVRDPTVYEDLKTILGNIERNIVFKALIRFTMEKDHLRRTERAPKPAEISE